MTLKEIIENVDQKLPNNLSLIEKLAYITTLDGIISTIILNREASIIPYTMSDIDKEGVIPFPFTDTYEHYLMSMIDIRNEDFDLYENHRNLYIAAYDRFVAHMKKLETRVPIFIKGVN